MNHPPNHDKMGGINHQQLVGYYCYTHTLRKSSTIGGLSLLHPPPPPKKNRTKILQAPDTDHFPPRGSFPSQCKADAQSKDGLRALPGATNDRPGQFDTQDGKPHRWQI